jgi:hypothetical protein
MKYVSLVTWSFIFLVVGFVYINPVNAMTFPQAQRIYYTVAQKNGIRPPKLILNPTREVNAMYTGAYVVVNQGMLNFVRNESEMALVLGHELGHYTGNHWESNYPNEYAADRAGFTYSIRAGFGGCKGAAILLRFGKASKDHPSGRDRYNRLCGGDGR